jgi:hypothetical protein
VTVNPVSISELLTADAGARWRVFIRTPREPEKLTPTIVRSLSVPAIQTSHSILSFAELTGMSSLYPSQLIARPALNVNAYGFAPLAGSGIENSFLLSSRTSRSVAALPKLVNAKARSKVRMVFKLSNVELIRVKDGATLAPPEACLTPTSDPLIG